MQTGTFKIVHGFDVDKYTEVLKRIETTIKTDAIKKNHNYPFIFLLTSQIKVVLNYLKVERKSKRSLNFLGSAWKWIAGSPDHFDCEIISSKVNNVLVNNNNQILINKLTIEKVNEITNITNNIIKTGKNDKNLEKESFLSLEVMKEEVINIAYAINWAKANIINSYILSIEETDIARKIIDKENIPIINLDETLEFFEIKLATNGKIIIYIVNLPIVENQTCKTVAIRSVKKNERNNKISFSPILNCGTIIYGIKNDCKNYNSLQICSRSNLVDLSNDSCTNNLLKIACQTVL